MKIFILMLCAVSLFADSYPIFTEDELTKIERSSGRIAKNRILDYQREISVLKTYNKTKQLNVVNYYLNQLLPQYDAVIQKQEDYWSSPKEFLTTGYGDCEDYVIIKYFTLLKLGFDEKKLFLTTATERQSKEYHMVLSYFKEKGESPLILDNISYKILDLKTRVDIKADTFINSSGVYKLDENNRLNKIAHHSKEYDELMKKVRENR